MNRVNFSKTINYNNFEENIVSFFDQVMALYDLIGRNCDMNISTESDPTSIRFVLLADDDEEASLLYNNIRDKVIPIYGHKYKAELSKFDNSLNIQLVEEASG